MSSFNSGRDDIREWKVAKNEQELTCPAIDDTMMWSKDEFEELRHGPGENTLERINFDIGMISTNVRGRI
jgi:hypothetical protein